MTPAEKADVYCAAAYYRISNDDKDLERAFKSESNSIRNQRDLIRNFVESRPEIILREEHADDGFSGVNFERPAFQAMMEEVRTGKINCILVKDLSRFGRNYIEAGRYIQKIFPCLGVRFIAVNDGYDSEDQGWQSDSMMLPFKNLMNDSYSRDISVKVKSQLEVKRRRGEFLGAFAVYGYQKSELDRNRLEPDPEAAEVVRHIYCWKLEGMSNDGIAVRLNAMGILSPLEYKRKKGLRYQTGFEKTACPGWSGPGIRRILTDEVYLGHMLQGKRTTPGYRIRKTVERPKEEWIRVDHTHKAIIQEWEYRAVEKLLRMDTRRAPEKGELSLLSGFLHCADCGETIVRKPVMKKGKRYDYAVCANSKKGGHICTSHRIRTDRMEEALHCYLNLLLMQYGRGTKAETAATEYGKGQKAYEKCLLACERQKAKLEELREGLHRDESLGVISKEECTQLREWYEYRILLEDTHRSSLRKEQEADQRHGHDRELQKMRIIREGGLEFFTRTVVLCLLERISVLERKRVKIYFTFKNPFADGLDAEEGIWPESAGRAETSKRENGTEGTLQQGM